MEVRLEQLEHLTIKALQLQGHSSSEAAEIYDCLVHAELRGNSQGVIKVTGGGMPKSKAVKPVKVIKKSAISAVVDGQQNQGVLVLNRAFKEATAMASSSQGFALVGTRNTSSSSGCLGYYVTKAAKQGFIAFCFAQSPPLTAPHGGSQARFGTNPVSIGLPSNHTSGPVALDFGASTISFYELLSNALSKKPLLPGTGYDSDGKASTDADRVLADGAITARGVVGSGLAFVVEAMAGALVGAGLDLEERPVDQHGMFNNNWGHFVLLFHPNLLSETFADDVKRLADRVHSSGVGGQPVYTPGQRGNEKAQKSRQRGSVVLPVAVYEALQKAATAKANL